MTRQEVALIGLVVIIFISIAISLDEIARQAGKNRYIVLRDIKGNDNVLPTQEPTERESVS